MVLVTLQLHRVTIPSSYAISYQCLRNKDAGKILYRADNKNLQSFYGFFCLSQRIWERRKEVKSFAPSGRSQQPTSKPYRSPVIRLMKESKTEFSSTISSLISPTFQNPTWNFLSFNIDITKIKIYSTMKFFLRFKKLNGNAF